MRSNCSFGLRGSRDSTTVPAQSLTLLNDPFVVSVAEHCAKRVLDGAGDSTGARIEALFETILAREPSPEEAARFAGLADRLTTLNPASELEEWRDLAHVLLNTKELLYVE